MFDEAPIDEALTTLGYQRRKRFVYQAQWSSPEIEHFISFTLYGASKSLLTGRFGLRNPHAEAFGVNCIRVHGGDLFLKILKPNERIGTRCRMSFEFARLTSPARRWSIYVPNLSNFELRDTLRAFIGDRLLPVVQNVTGLAQFFSLLTNDAEPCPWLVSNGAIRAAQIVAVGRQIGLEMNEIRAILEPHERDIFRGLTKTSGKEPDAGLYIDQIIADWQEFSLQLRPLAREKPSGTAFHSTQ